MNEEKNENFDQIAMEDLVYGNHHALNIVLDLLIEKGIINESEFREKMDAMIEESEDIKEDMAAIETQLE